MATLEIDDALLAEAMSLLKARDPRALVEDELRALLKRRKAQLRLIDLAGTIEWDGDLDEMRRDRSHISGEK